MFNKFRMGAAGAAIAAALAFGGAAQAADNADATATAEILSALTLELETGSSLDFGAVVVSGAGSLTMAADGTLDCSDANLICSGTTDVPVFNITGGTADENVKIIFDHPVTSGDPILLVSSTAVDPANPTTAEALVASNFTTDSTFTASSTVADLDQYGDPTGTFTTTDAYYGLQLDSSGEGRFSVGADLDFDGDETPGVYTGTFNVKVEYS